jgi:transcriptional regulator of acetoin/glycerol metabolism
VRELRNLLESIIVLSVKEQIELADLPEQISKVRSARAIIQPGMTMAEIEREAIRRTLEETGGRRAQTAEILGISVRTLHRKIKEYGLPT